MKPELVLPAYIGMRNPEPLFRFCEKVAEHDGDIEIDASAVKFIDVMGLTVLCALLSPLCACRNVSVIWMSVSIAAYLERMNFFEHCPVKGVEFYSTVPRSDLSRSLVEITSISSAHETNSTASRLAIALTGSMTGLLPKPISFDGGRDEFEAYCHPIEYALTELLDNAFTHARREGHFRSAVWVAAQLYNEDVVRIGVVDTGCGFLATLKGHPRRPKSDVEAIELALEPFISCNRDLGMYLESTNEGVGLTTTCNIAKAAGGGMTIVSGNARYSTMAGCSQFTGDASWPGVAISFGCKRALLPQTQPSKLLPALPESTNPAPTLRFSD